VHQCSKTNLLWRGDLTLLILCKLLLEILKFCGFSILLVSDFKSVVGEQGVPVVKSSQTMRVSRDDCHFGTKCFQSVTKMKSRTVLHLLQLGFKVLFSDVDVYWFQVRPLLSLASILSMNYLNMFTF
jgi:hypothetical protein